MLKNSIASPQATINLLKTFGLSLYKAYGQNFLVDENILKKIINDSNLSKSDVVLEVGGGIGTLSLALVKKAGFVHIVELEKSFLRPLQHVLGKYSNYQIHSIDALKLNCKALEPLPNKMVSNLPYNIAAPLMVKTLIDCERIHEYYIMAQKEMADRFTAMPNSKDYSALSVKIQLFSKPKKLFTVSRNSFLPKPSVDSIFLSIIKKDFIFRNLNFLLGIIEDGFHYRRKKLLKSLMLSGRYNENSLINAFNKADISIDTRAQELTREDFVTLAGIYLKQNGLQVV